MSKEQSLPTPPRDATPRTDEKAMRFVLSAGGNSTGIPIDGQWVHADFARQLERELAEANRDLYDTRGEVPVLRSPVSESEPMKAKYPCPNGEECIDSFACERSGKCERETVAPSAVVQTFAPHALADELDRIAAQEERDLRYGTEATNRNTKPLREAAIALRSASERLLDEAGKFFDWGNAAGDALKAMMEAYERRIRSLCTPEQLEQRPWECAEFIVSKRTLEAKPNWVVDVDTANLRVSDRCATKE